MILAVFLISVAVMEVILQRDRKAEGLSRQHEVPGPRAGSSETPAADLLSLSAALSAESKLEDPKRVLSTVGAHAQGYNRENGGGQ